MNTVPIRPKKTRVTDTLAALKRRLRKMAISIIGSLTWRSQATKTPRTTAPTVKAPRID